ncbi:divergent AAA domain protein [Bacteroidales bacterium KA00344]|nr:divergent AAA domain protein [Bacteroidales bacterium KA00344]
MCNRGLSYLEELIAQGEHQHQDFKYKIQDAVKLAKSVSAFANTDGGRLLIGVRDDGHISGVRSEEETFMMEKVAAEYCKPAAAISFDTYNAEGRMVVVATIPRATRRPVCAIDERGRKTAYVRIKDENIAASPIHLEMWKQDKASTVMMAYNKNETQLIDTLKAHPDVTLNRLVRLAKLSRYKVIKSLARFIRYDIAVMKYKDEKFVFALSDTKSSQEV